MDDDLLGNDHLVMLEIDDDDRLHFTLPLDFTAEEFAYFETLVARAERGVIELLDPRTREIVFSVRVGRRVTH